MKGKFAAGILALLLTTVAGWWTWPTLPPAPDLDVLNTSYRPGGLSCTENEISKLPDRASRKSQFDRCAKEKEEYRLQATDLLQQAKAAEAAEAQAFVAGQQLRMGWVQTFGGLLTLVAAVLAAFYARAAALASRDALDHERSKYKPVLDITANFGQSFSKDAQDQFQSEPLGLGFHFTNIGMSPIESILFDKIRIELDDGTQVLTDDSNLIERKYADLPLGTKAWTEAYCPSFVLEPDRLLDMSYDGANVQVGAHVACTTRYGPAVEFQVKLSGKMEVHYDGVFRNGWAITTLKPVL